MSVAADTDNGAHDVVSAISTVLLKVIIRMSTKSKRLARACQITALTASMLLLSIVDASVAGELTSEFALTAPNEISAVFPKTEYRYASPSNDWIQIPRWLTGTWCEYLDAPSETDFDRLPANKSQLNKPSEVRILTLGMKTDKSGTFWHYAGVPWQRQIEQSGLIEKQTVELFKPVGSPADGFSILSATQVTISDARTGAEKDHFRQKVSSTYLPVADGKIRIHITTYRYNLDNVLVSRTEQAGSGVRLTEFILSDNKELEQKFQQFLQK